MFYIIHRRLITHAMNTYISFMRNQSLWTYSKFLELKLKLNSARKVVCQIWPWWWVLRQIWRFRRITSRAICWLPKRMWNRPTVHHVRLTYHERCC